MLCRDTFSIIAQHLDGRDVSNLSQMCKAWYRFVKEDKNLAWRKKIHHVKVATPIEAENAIAPNSKLQKLDEEFATRWFKNVFEYGFNVDSNALLQEEHRMVATAGYVYQAIRSSTINRYISCFLNNNTNEFIFIDTYFTDNFECCCSYTCDCGSVEDTIENIERINAAFPGLISNWKYIELSQSSFFLKKAARGKNCLAVTLRPKNTVSDMQNLDFALQHVAPSEQQRLVFAARNNYLEEEEEPNNKRQKI